MGAMKPLSAGIVSFGITLALGAAEAQACPKTAG